MLLLLVACTQGDTQVYKVYPEMIVFPDSVEFGDVAVGYSGNTTVQIQNAGAAKLDISSITLTDDGGGVFSLTDPGAPLQLAADEVLELPLTFLPPTFLEYAGVLHVSSNDPETPEKDVLLSGVGVDAPQPDIDVAPPSVDFGDVTPGNFGTETFTIENTGEGTLTLGTLTQRDSGAFSVVSGSIDGYAIPAGQQQTVVLMYAPTTALGDNATITITSDDPDEPSVDVLLVGNGGGDYEYPVAQIDCVATSEPRKTIELDGNASYDPGGSQLTYQWTLLSTPEGSGTEGLLNETSPGAYLTMDIAGDYVTQLKVTNEIGLTSSPATCTTSAIPDEQLHVELIWDTGGADMDLHLAQGGHSIYDGTYDCNWCRQSPEWGVSGIDDNPVLDIDDQQGYGPENINIDVPADGAYDVYVHYFNDGGDDVVVATVKVYLYGVEVDSLSKAMERDNVWYVGQINWPDGTLGVVDTLEETSAKHSCD